VNILYTCIEGERENKTGARRVKEGQERGAGRGSEGCLPEFSIAQLRTTIATAQKVKVRVDKWDMVALIVRIRQN
jgi:hypothetical protein